ncbi:MAG TPA: YoaK family protein [Tepidisphaeraceae bacterium]|nr:YoaK family protein [Tepidisphaeraceae bacterium]
MFVSQAHSFRQKSRLAISLSWIGGYTNTIALLLCGTVVSHVTGNTTNFGRAFSLHEYREALYFGGLWLSFLSGAVLSGLITEVARQRGFASKYAIPIAVEAVLLSAFGLLGGRAWPIHQGHQGWAYGLAALAAFTMGLQNATITRIAGTVVRTTHLTGVTTDLGLEAVQFGFWLRRRLHLNMPCRSARVLRIARRQPNGLAALMLASIVGSFLLGAAIGTIAFAHLHAGAMLFPVLFLIWIVCIDRFQPVGRIVPIDPEHDAELRKLDLTVRRISLWRITATSRKPHRAPDILHWAQHTTVPNRAMILAIDAATVLDRNALSDLHHGAAHLRERGADLILADIKPWQFRLLKSAGVCNAIGIANICSDIEYAIARAIDLAGESEENTAAA